MQDRASIIARIKNTSPPTVGFWGRCSAYGDNEIGFYFFFGGFIVSQSDSEAVSSHK